MLKKYKKFSNKKQKRIQEKKEREKREKEQKKTENKKRSCMAGSLSTLMRTVMQWTGQRKARKKL